MFKFSRHNLPSTDALPTTQQEPTIWPPQQEYDEYDLIINVAARLYVGSEWLMDRERVKKTDIQEVVDEAKSAREEAEATGRALTDRDLYIGARKLIDVPESETERDGRNYRSFSILAALMGGKPSGKLPF
ncbi:MAG: hypothetical protein ABI354_02665 [Candidatus Saccharimonadales bacterium]